MKNKIAYTKPSITEREVSYATDAAANGWGERCYEYITRFEKEFAKHLGVKYAIATSSCTGAIHMGLAALNIGAGDEVILADTNWIASVAPIVHLGAKPVFVDVCPESWCLDPKKVEAGITKNTKAILAVHIYGNLCYLDELLALGEKYKIPVIEDAAEAIGSIYKGRRAGSIGLFGTFSFHGTKTITTGEGGMFVTNSDELYEKVLTFSNHGRSRFQKKQFWPDVVGFKYKMSNIQAAIGLAQVERIEELIQRKRDIFNYYKNGLTSITGIKMNPEMAGCQNGFWMPTVVFSEESGITRDVMLNSFREEEIDARVFFYPLSSLDFFESVQTNINSWSIPERAINLPSFHSMTESQQDRVINVILKITRKFRE